MFTFNQYIILNLKGTIFFHLSAENKILQLKKIIQLKKELQLNINFDNYNTKKCNKKQKFIVPEGKY